MEIEMDKTIEEMIEITKDENVPLAMRMMASLTGLVLIFYKVIDAWEIRSKKGDKKCQTS